MTRSTSALFLLLALATARAEGQPSPPVRPIVLPDDWDKPLRELKQRQEDQAQRMRETENSMNWIELVAIGLAAGIGSVLCAGALKKKEKGLPEVSARLSTGPIIPAPREQPKASAGEQASAEVAPVIQWDKVLKELEE